MLLERHTLVSRPDLAASADLVGRRSWPPFILHSDVRNWRSLFTEFAGFQILFLEPPDVLVAVGHTVPMAWAGTVEDLPPTINAILDRARSSLVPNTLVALGAIVAPEHRGRGHSERLVRAMRDLAAEHKFGAFLAPVRPTAKSERARMPMEEYARLTRADGAPFDPWIRVHWKLGAVVLAVAPSTLTVEGPVAEWERWTGLSFPESGDYEVPGALQPVRIDRVLDRGRYDEPNVWMRHEVAGEERALQSSGSSEGEQRMD